MAKERDHRPQLYINTSPLVGEAEGTIYTETDKYSITPKRFPLRRFFSEEPLMELLEEATPVNVTEERLLNAEDLLFYRDTYSHTSWSSDVHRFGINPHNIAIREALVQHNQAQIETIRSSGKFKSKVSNASSHGVYTEFVKCLEPTQFEHDLVQHALHYLDESGQKVVLVDTFPRALKSDTKKKLNCGDIEIPPKKQALELHTVLLYKNEETDEILVIDPNNPKFSGHLGRMGETIGRSMVVDTSPSELHKIYVRPDKSTIGPSSSDYRECIDISIKLAALLARDDTIYSDHEQIMASNNVRLLSNNIKIMKLDILDANIPLRIKQISDLGEMVEINSRLLEHDLIYETKRKAEDARFDEEMQQVKKNHDQELRLINEEQENSALELLGQLTDSLGEYYE
jgi:hypothetical protein